MPGEPVRRQVGVVKSIWGRWGELAWCVYGVVFTGFDVYWAIAGDRWWQRAVLVVIALLMGAFTVGQIRRTGRFFAAGRAL